MRYIISAGGTGGHIYPALSIINKIKEEDKNAKILYIGTTDRMEKDIVPNLGIDYLGIKMNGLTKSVKKIFGFLTNTLVGLKKCKKIMKKFKPDIVIGVGGYVTVPVVLAAHSQKVKIILHEQNSIPGKANKLLSKYASTICISMESSRKYFEHNNIVLTGNPRGEEILKFKKGNKKDYDLSISKKLVLITMGSLGAETINKKIIELLDDFSNKNYEVLLVTGKDNYEEVVKNKLPKNVKVVPYIEKMGEVLKFTDLIITRAGATIISEITALHIPSILIPSPYVANNHQVINAKDLENNKAAFIVEETSFNKKDLLEKIDKILGDSKLYGQMSSASKKLGITDSATRIYEEIRKVI
ncbi:MAG: undecaprenyldiphospho-muramoylpentapeptide beta-N-acetylglucosaminyltransferase [Bacilli bacterium]